MSRRYRRRGRRPLGESILTALVVAGLTYAVLTRFAHMNGNAAAMLAAFAAGFVVRAGVRVPYIRTGWRRPR